MFCSDQTQCCPYISFWFTSPVMRLPDVITLHLPKKSVLLSDIQRDVMPFPFTTSPGTRVVKVSGSEMFSLRMADSGSRWRLEVEEENFKHDMDALGCVCSVCLCKSKKRMVFDGVKLPFDPNW
ncbi:hypothetical protein AVEN_209253-1 [Araneus ventricosus]|uniref:Uncharacterized protein n=1 Tax=Araneus ventricosus TaxID=182803 RepID=A0A4Y2UWK3_ARAVE|nr:hypothetical protein AVEN_209253-1 [Araneus ventricosus]